jgi:uncharacterized protein
MASRRAFLAGLAAATLPRPVWADVGRPAFIAAAKRGESYELHALSATGESLFHIPLPARGHAGCAHPTQATCVAFARRPGTYALVINVFSGDVPHQLTPPENRHFNGHGTFSADGAVLYTVEQAADDSTGYLGIWDTRTFRRIAETPTHGIGPHDLKCLPDGSLLIANGGIATDPTDRSKLNLATMRANLAQLAPDGTLLGLAELPSDMQQNSIRHLALVPGGAACALQWEGDPAEPVPLLALWRDGAITLHAAPEAEAYRMQGYAGSIAATDRRIAMTSSHGGVVQLFDINGHFIQTLTRGDASGIAAMGEAFLMSDGTGALTHVFDSGIAPVRAMPLAWDNHLVTIR